jgi:hypothetical protein
MDVGNEVRSMANKKMGRPGKPHGEGKSVRLDPSLVAKARAVANHRGQTLGDYFLSFSLAIVNRDYAAVLREIEKGFEPENGDK